MDTEHNINDVDNSIDLKNEGNSILTETVEPIPKIEFFFMNVGNALLKAFLWIVDLILSIFLSLGHFFKGIYDGVVKGSILTFRFFKRKCHQFKYNDLFGRLSFFIFGTSSFKNKQYVNGVLYVLFEIGYILFMALFGVSAIGKLSHLGTVVPGTGDCEDMFCEYTKGDNSIMILIYGLLCILSIILFLYIWNRSIESGYDNYRINNFMKFKNEFIRNKEFSEKIDQEATECVYDKSLNRFQFKKEHLEELEEYIDTFNVEDGDKFSKNFAKYIYDETIVNAYDEVKIIKKTEEKAAKLQLKLTDFKEARAMKRNSLAEKGTDLNSFDNRTQSKINEYKNKIRAIQNKVNELKKRHNAFANKAEIINSSKYEKFNEYYKVLEEKKERLTFFEHYFEILSVFRNSRDGYQNKNDENRQTKLDLVLSTKEKIKEINANFDEIIDKKIALNAKIAELKVQEKAEIKALKEVPNTNLDRQEKIAEIKAKYFPEISRLSTELHELPDDKHIKAMRKEEIKETTHASKRDLKYLKTNFTQGTYSIEQAKNFMLIEYKLNYKFVNKIAKEYFTPTKNGNILELNREEVDQKIAEINSFMDEYKAEHEDKFVGKAKTFKQQVNSLLNENFHVTILTIPVLGIILFTVVPLLFSILIAFTNYAYGHQPPTQLFTWIGFENFNSLFNAPADSIYAILPSALASTLGWTIAWTFLSTFSNYFLGIILALLINKKGIKFKKVWRTIFIMTIAIPQFISLMLIGIALKDTGVLGVWWNDTFGYKLGFATSSQNGALISKVIILIVNVWVGIPYTMLSTTGILLNIPRDLYESATVDGAGTVTQFTKITLPYILFVTGPYLITQFIGNINNFNVIYFLTGGGPNLAGTVLQIGHTDLLITFLYKMITSNNNPQFGIASSVGIIIFVICAFFSIIMYNKSGAVQSEDQFQ